MTTHATPTDLRQPIDSEQLADIETFREALESNRAGEIDDETFRVFRLGRGIYGQRQGGTNQMVRVKVPYGSIKAEQLDMLAFLVDRYSRGWAHITTRQNFQFHYVQLDEVVEVMQHLAEVGLTTREACGNTVRNVMGCHLAGACPIEKVDISPWAEATYRHFVRNPIAQRLPRKFKINFSGCDTDCGQAMFNDAGVIATTRTRSDGTTETGFRVFIAGGLGANPHPALALEDFTSRHELMATLEAILRVFDAAGNRDNRIRARMKWLVDTLGFDEVQRRVIATRAELLDSDSTTIGIPAEVSLDGDDPAGTAPNSAVTQIGQGTPVTLSGTSGFSRWSQANVVRGAANGTISAYATAELGDITSAQFRALASIQREFDSDVRLTNRQNLVLRDLTTDDLPVLFERLTAIGMASPSAELVRDVVACPGADTCNLAVTQSRGLAQAIGQRLEQEGLAEVGGVRINISGCTNSCGQHHAADIGFFGMERRLDGRSAPGYQMMLGGYVGQEQMHFGRKVLRLPAKNAPEAAVRVIRTFADQRNGGERFHDWLVRIGGPATITDDLKDLENIPTDGAAAVDYYTDYNETGPYVATVGDSECAT